ncbi:ABC transporter substrate-binding protein [Azospirillum sp. sgz301742]
MRWWTSAIPIVVLTAMLALLVRCAEPEAAGRGRVIGVLTSAAVALPAYDGFRAGMAEIGGNPVSYMFSGVMAADDALAAEASRLVNAGSDLILALTTKAALAARDAGRERGVPVIFAPASNPLKTGLAASLRQPGGLATGVTFGRQEARRLEWLLRLMPGLGGVYVPYTRNDPSPLASLAVLQEAARKLNLPLTLAPVDGWKDMQATLERLPDGVQAILITPDPELASHARELAAFSMERGIALSMPHREGVEQGALMSYGFDLYSLGGQAAHQGALVLSGVAPAEIPVEMAEFSLSINLEAARRIGLAIPPTILRQAHVVAP